MYTMLMHKFKHNIYAQYIHTDMHKYLYKHIHLSTGAGWNPDTYSLKLMIYYGVLHYVWLHTKLLFVQSFDNDNNNIDNESNNFSIDNL